MSYIPIALNHFRSIQSCSKAASVQASLDCATFCLELKGHGRYFTLYPQFTSLHKGRQIYTAQLVHDTLGFIGWLPYRPVSWATVSDKLSFKRLLTQHGMRTPNLLPHAAAPNQPYLVKSSGGSFGYGLHGPFPSGTPIRVPPHASSDVPVRGENFSEAFVPGSILKVWFWGQEGFFAHRHEYPRVVGNGRQTVKELVQQRLSRVGRQFDGNGDQESIVASLDYQGATQDSVLPDGVSLWIDYRYGRQYANTPVATVSDSALPLLSDPIRTQIAEMGILLGGLLEQHFGAPTLYAVDGVIDANGDVWWLEANTNPMVPPDGYHQILATLFNVQTTIQPEGVWICSKVRRCLRDFVASIDSQVESLSANGSSLLELARLV